MREAARVSRGVVVLGVVAAGLLLVIGCKPVEPYDLKVTDTLRCTVEWQQMSANEDGFRVYTGGSCANECAGNMDWKLAGTVGADVTTFSWTKTCCDVAECICATVRAFNSEGESDDSNRVVLAPVC